jgi:hypothetical protein
MIVPQFQTRLLLSFPESTWSGLVRSIQEGVRKADVLMRETPAFGGVIGNDLRGHIRRLHILHEFQEASRRGRLPYEASPSKMPIGTWHWLDIRSGGMIAHLARTETPDGRPDATENRQALCVTNQYNMLDDGTIPPVDLIITKARYAYVTFGMDRAGVVTHVSLGMPSSDNSHWLAFAKLMRRSSFPEPIAIPPPAPLSPPVAESIRFVPEVAERLHQPNKKNDDKSA